MIETDINNRWRILLPEHRAARPEWPVWELERLASMYENIKPGDTVYDIGTEEGDISALIAQWVGEEGHMVLFEPNPKVWPNIRAIWEANKLKRPLGWFVGFAAAVNDLEPPRLNVSQEAQDGWPVSAFGPLIGDHGFRHLAQEADATPRIRLDHFRHYIHEHEHSLPDVITMDVEGAELEVLKGSEAILKHWHPVVYVSLHPEFMRDMFGQEPGDIHSFMFNLGYNGRHLATDHEEHWVFWHPEGRQVV